MSLPFPSSSEALSPSLNATLTAALFAVDPCGTGGVALRCLASPVRDRWLVLVREWLPATAPLRRMPLHVSDSRLLGGLDLTATLRAGRPVAERGLLAEADGGVVVLAMAERISPATAARLAAVLDQGEVTIGRDGVALKDPARIGVIALDEGIDDEQPPAALIDRLAFLLDLSSIRLDDMSDPIYSHDEIADARTALPTISVDAESLNALCATADALGIASVRPVLLALRAARAAAALAGHAVVTEDDVVLAAQLVLAPRARVSSTVEPVQEQTVESNAQQQRENRQENEQESHQEQQPDQVLEHAATQQNSPSNESGESQTEERSYADRPLDDVVLEAARAAIPAGLLAQLKAGHADRRSTSSGKSGAMQQSGTRGRPAGLRQGPLRAGARLNVIETLRAAVPWQRLRRQSLENAAMAKPPQTGPKPIKQKHTAQTIPRVLIESQDLRITRYRQRAETTTIFVVDASGSSALHRLAEAKGAVELLLADCYVRRDRVAVIAFRGKGAELLLPPTRSLVRAKRSLSSLPGGGGTPLAAGIDAAVQLADLVRRGGRTPTVVLLTDGRGNIARDGTPGREHAQDDVLSASRRIRLAELKTLLVDTSPRPQASAELIAKEMGARYLALPYADSAMLSRVVRSHIPPISNMPVR